MVCRHPPHRRPIVVLTEDLAWWKEPHPTPHASGELTLLLDMKPQLPRSPRVELPPDCATCGACCREAFDSVPVDDDDARTLTNQRALVVEHDDGWRDLKRVPTASGCGSRCAALHGDGDQQPFRCTIYDDRPAACSDLEVGGENCRLARTRVGFATA